MAIGETYKNMIEENLKQCAFGPSLDSFNLEISDLSISEGAILGAGGAWPPWPPLGYGPGRHSAERHAVKEKK